MSIVKSALLVFTAALSLVGCSHDLESAPDEEGGDGGIVLTRPIDHLTPGAKKTLKVLKCASPLECAESDPPPVSQCTYDTECGGSCFVNSLGMGRCFAGCDDDKDCGHGFACVASDKEGARGSCLPVIEKVCTLEYAPVCGSDGNSYSNACFAVANGAEVEHAGACKEMPTACDGDDCEGEGEGGEHEHGEHEHGEHEHGEHGCDRDDDAYDWMRG